MFLSLLHEMVRTVRAQRNGFLLVELRLRHVPKPRHDLLLAQIPLKKADTPENKEDLIVLR